MSEPKLISPMLDDFDMGGPISDHDGVKCCPAMRKNSDDKYIVKIISVPTSQTKLEALLLTGAYSDKNAALAYFKDVADGIVEEKKILDKLAQLEGFVAYEDCQIVPMHDATGYDVYLLGEYRMTLERQNARKPMTQLAAVNLGLDLCAALAICRRSGYMFVDLKPSNIFITGDKEYCIGDLGFVRLNSLKYESLPDKYRSSYTAPEVEDPFAPLSTTMDIFSAGLILYQAFNGGELPTAKDGKFEAPAYADSEMAQIILKACDPDPISRWQDPVDMGQAIVSYMQKNGVNDTPLTAQILEEQISDSEETEEIPDVEAVMDIPVTEDVLEEALTQETEQIPDEPEEPVPAEEPESTLIDVSVDDAEPVLIDIPVDEDKPQTEEAEEVQVAEEPVSDANAEKLAEKDKLEAPEEEYDNLSFLDENGEIDLDEAVDYDSVTDEVSEILNQIDELTAHPVPEPVVAPDPIEIKIPDPIVPEEASEEEKAAEEDISVDNNEEAENQTDADDEKETDEQEEQDDVQIPEEEMPYVPKKKHTGLIWCIVIVILLGLAVGGYFFYQEYYLQPIHSLDLTGSEDQLQVQLSADIDESLLTVICADSHGNKIPAPVVGGTAVFTGLSADTAYTVTVEVDGFHKLTGVTSKVYSTPVQTKIAHMSVITGSESGSVILSFTPDGPDSKQWNVIYNTEGEAERVTAFPSHMVTLTGLTVGKEYTFRLEPVDDIYLTGEAQTTYVVKNLICAENLRAVSCTDGKLTVQWDTPTGETVAQWSVRCYNDAGFDETITTTENTATFENIDDSKAFSVEVTAAEMSVSERVQISANSITVSEFAVDTSKADVLTLSWKANREIPAAGWTIRYSVNGVNAASTVTAAENTVQIPVIPNGNYVFNILDGDGNAVLGGPFTHTQAEAKTFEAYSVTKSDMSIRLCQTPAASSWSYKDITDEQYVNSFSAGQKISMVIALSGSTTKSDDTVTTTFAIYDENDNLVSFSHGSQTWKSMWYENYCELDIPGVPTEVGTYNLIVFFNGAEAGSQKFAITA